MKNMYEILVESEINKRKMTQDKLGDLYVFLPYFYI